MKTSHIPRRSRHLLLYLALASAPGLALAGVVKGTVTDEQGKPLPETVILAVALPDSTLVGSSLSDIEGAFSLSYDSIAPNLIIASRTGFEKLEFPVANLDASANLVMIPAGKYLSEVTVKAKPKMAKADGGLFSFSPAFLQKDFPNGAMVLNTLPLLEETGGLIQMLRKSGEPQIWINGRDPMMAQSALMEMLRATPTKNIKKVEIITNPSLEQGDFKAGIINLIIEKPEIPFVGSVSASLDDNRDHFSPGMNIYANFSKNSISAAIYAGYAYKNSYSPSTTDYFYKDLTRHVRNQLASRLYQNQLTTGVNLQKDLTPYQSAGINFTLNATEVTSNIRTLSSATQDNMPTATSEALSRMHVPWTRPIISGRIWYYGIFPEVMSLEANIFGWTNRYEQNETLSETSETGPSALWTTVSSQDKISRRKGIGGKLVMSSRFSDKYSVNLSYYGGYSDISESMSDTYNPGALFGYTELLNTVTLSAQARFGTLCSLYAGLQGEFTHTDTRSNGNNNPITDNYFNLVPNASLSFSIPAGSQQIQLAYSRSISRPQFRSLNPFRYWTSATTYNVGNPELREYPFDYLSYYHSFLNNFSAYVRYSHAKDMVVDYINDDGEGYSMSSTANAGTCHSVNFGFNYSKSFFDGIWRMSASVWGTYLRYKGSVASTVINQRSTYWGIDFGNNFILSRRHQLMARIDYAYHSRTAGVWRTYSPTHALYISIDKNFPWGAVVSLRSYNLLGFKKNERHDSADYSYSTDIPYSGNGFSLSFAYTFGNRRLHNARGREVSSGESRAAF